jgi:hypothetical protein
MTKNLIQAEFAEKSGRQKPVGDVPRMLYKLRAFDEGEYWRGNLLGSTLWCSSKDAFNDPAEFQHEIERHPSDVEQVYHYWLSVYPHWQGQLGLHAVPFMVAEMVSDYIESVGVCCFSESATNSQMWAQYAGDHTGYCLAFDFEELRQVFGENNLHRVTYAPECPRVPVTVFAKRPYDLYRATLPALTTKHVDWKHEREWRYLHREANASVAYPSHALREVILGARTSPQRGEALVKAALQANPQVRIREAIAIPRSYELGIRDAYDDDP